MAKIGSPRYDNVKMIRLIEDYFDNDVENISSYAEVELRNMVMEGEDIIDAINYIKDQIDEQNEILEDKIERYSNRIKEYHKIIRELKKPTLAKNLESLIKGKEGPFIEKIKELLKK